MDYELIPHVWREPNRILAGNKPGDLRFEKELLGRELIVVWQTGGASVTLKTLYVKSGA